MREFMDGFEAQAPAEAGYAGGSSFGRQTDTVNEDTFGNGGTYSIRNNFASVATMATPQFFNGAVREVWVRIYVYFVDPITWTLSVGNGDGTEQASVQFVSGTQFFNIRRGAAAGTLLATGTTAFSLNTWHRVDIRFFVDNTAGEIEVFVNDGGSYTTPEVSVSAADTQNLAGNTFDKLIFAWDGTGSRFDDLRVHSISLSYDGGSGGVPVAGETITDATTGATAVITSVDGDATSGRLILHTWDGTAFGDNNQITSTGTFDALVNAPNANYVDGLEPHSKAGGAGFIVFLTPDGNGNSTGLTGSDADQVDNYLLVDDQPIDNDTATFVESNTDQAFDLYTLTGLPASANSINDLEIVTYARKDGTIVNNVSGVVRTGGANYSSEDTFDAALPGSEATQRFPFPLNPGTGTQWTVSEITGLEAGPRLEA